MSLLDAQSEWARMIMSAFAEAGVRELVLSPGSRSTPFAIAATHEPRLRITTIIDERAAAFFALGQARASGVPSLLLCTSGSAPAHYLPAIIEARHARLPLLALTADRPLEAMHAGAHQTIDQTRLFGEQVRASFELGGVDAAESALRGVRRLVAQAFSLAHDGAVHLNVRARKPLEPAPATDEITSSRIRAAAHAPLPRFSSPRTRATHALDALRARIVEEERGLIVVGPHTRPDLQLTAALVELSRRTGYPLVTEPTSQLTEGLPGALSTVFAGERTRTALQPRVVLQVGPAPVAGAYERVLDHAHLEIFAEHAAVDSESRARAVHVGDVVALIESLAATELARSSYARSVATAYLHAAETLAATLEPADELATVAMVARAAKDAAIFVGNSLPVRELAQAAALGAPTLAYHQRGASGIDGLVAGAAGLASHGRPTVLLVGDVSVLHDLHGLLIAAQSRTPLVVAVLCNGGGRIFDTLPVGRRDDLRDAMPLFTTPVAPDLAALARFCNVRYAASVDANEVHAAMTVALAHAGCTLLELVVSPGSAARLARELGALVDGACA